MRDDRKSVTFFPWLRLTKPIEIGRVAFLPFERGQPGAELRPVADRLDMILSSYRDIESKPIHACAVAFLQGRSADAELSDDDVQEIQQASALLALAAFAENEYFVEGGPYVNGTPFAPYYQGYGGEESSLSLTIRRRDGRTRSGGWKHGATLFVVPVECQHLSEVELDESFAESLGRADSAGWPTMGRVVLALSFFLLANTDSPLVMHRAEAILMGAALDQLLQTDAADEVADRVDALLRPYGSVKASSDFAKGRMSEAKAAHGEWFLHKAWAWEFYVLRSMLVHGRDITKREWHWSLGEHLLVAAFVFPLFVKLLLARDSLYELTDDDGARCAALDRLLAIPNWGAPACAPGRPARWQEVIRGTRVRYGIERAFEEAKRRREAVE